MHIQYFVTKILQVDEHEHDFEGISSKMGECT